MSRRRARAILLGLFTVIALTGLTLRSHGADRRAPRCRDGQALWFTGGAFRQLRCVDSVPQEKGDMEAFPEGHPDLDLLKEVLGTWEGYVTQGADRYDSLFYLGKSGRVEHVAMLSLKESHTHRVSTVWARIDPPARGRPSRAEVWPDALPALGLDAFVHWSEVKAGFKAYTRSLVLRYPERAGSHHLEWRVDGDSLYFRYVHRAGRRLVTGLSGTFKRTDKDRL